MLLHDMAFGRIWQHAKYSYGVCQSFVYNSENFQKTPKIEKCKHLFQMFGFGYFINRGGLLTGAGS